MQVVVQDKDWTVFLQGPDLLVYFRVLDKEKFTVHRVVDEQIHVL